MPVSKKSQTALKLLQKTINAEAKKIPKNHYEKFFKEYLGLIKFAQSPDYLDKTMEIVKIESPNGRQS